MERRIYTHRSPSVSSCLAIIVAIKYILRESLDNFFKQKNWRDRIQFKDANWSGKEMTKRDIAINIFAGGKGIQGSYEEGSKVTSALLNIFEQYAPYRDQMIMGDVIWYVNEEDITSDAIGSLLLSTYEHVIAKDVKKILWAGSICPIYRALQWANNYDDKKVIKIFAGVYEGMLAEGIKNLKLPDLYEKRAVVHRVHGSEKCIVVLDMNGAPLSLCRYALEKEKVEIIIFKNGKDIGLIRANNSKFPVDHQLIRDVINKAGEKVGKKQGEWAISPSKHQICRGSHSAPVETASKVSAGQLVVAVYRVLNFMKK